ncbi:unnamed protein product [Arctia plantaginis]|uniref:Uncharacterized protein n=1 Tax=Arctia plantaginis TaxID=874455 RepID=A0A8S1B6E7_ARCPL|nr:unnamed protein product [Arctia plantaginis]
MRQIASVGDWSREHRATVAPRAGVHISTHCGHSTITRESTGSRGAGRGVASRHTCGGRGPPGTLPPAPRAGARTPAPLRPAPPRPTAPHCARTSAPTIALEPPTIFTSALL